MRTLAALTFSLVLPLFSEAAVLDPAGDTYGTGMQFDILSVAGITSGNSTTFDIRFATPLPADLDANLWGAIEIDMDRNQNTGKTSELDYPTSNFPLGVDYVIAYYYDDAPGTAFVLDVLNDQLFEVSAEYGADFFRITVPIRGFDGSRQMNYAVGVGDGQDINSPYSDIAGNGYQVLQTTVVPEPGTWVLCGAAFGLIGFVRLRRRPAIVPGR